MGISRSVSYTHLDQAFAPGEIKRAESNGGYASVGNRDGYNWVWENTVNYTNTFEDVYKRQPLLYK